jgi:hypothetical protein
LSLIIPVGVNFGVSKPALAGATVRLLDDDRVTVLDGPNALYAMGSGDYVGELELPDAFVRGYVQGAANDASGDTVTFPVLLADIGIIQSGVGDHTVTFTVRDNQGTPQPIEGASVTVKSGSTIVAWGQTSILGVLALGLPAGSYTYTVTAGPNYTQEIDAALVVNGAESVSVTLDEQAAAPPAAAGLCTVRFYVTLNRTAKSGYVCRARLVGKNEAAANELLSSVIERAATDATGIADLVLVQQAQFVKGDGLYEITVTAPDGTETFKVRAKMPNASTANAEDLIPA